MSDHSFDKIRLERFDVEAAWGENVHYQVGYQSPFTPPPPPHATMDGHVR